MERQNDLFRQQALQYSTQRFYGDVSSLNGVNMWAVVVFLIFIVVVALIYLFMADYSKTQVVNGYINPKDGLVSIHSRRNGSILKRLYVDEGALVQSGDKLALFSSANRLSTGRSLDRELIVDLKNTLKDLKEISERQSELSSAKLTRLNEQLDEADRELDIQSKFALKYHQRLQVQKSLQDARKDLYAQGVLSSAQWLDMKSEFLEYEASLLDAQQLTQEYRSKRNSIRYQINQHPAETAKQQRELDLRISEIDRQITQLEGGKDELLVAPIAGKVVALQYSLGDASFPNVPVLSIVPSNSKVEGIILMPSAAIGFIEVGQSIQLRLDAYPHQQYGTQTGTIRTVSGAPISASEINAPISVSGPVYIAKAELQSSQIEIAGQQKKLQPGMLFAADVLLERRSFMEWILEPFFGLKGRTV
ncbi:MAG: HlyD family efflux transporter periplasmic adaptor subunit [Pseudomonadota bacterium]